MNKELKVIEVPSSGNKDWYGGAYCIVFVYSKYNGNFILKGYRDEVSKYLSNNYTHYFANYTLWYKKQFRTIWVFWKSNYYICVPDRHKQKPSYFNKTPRKPEYKWVLTNFSKENNIKLKFRRFPKRWIPEFDKL